MRPHVFKIHKSAAKVIRLCLKRDAVEQGVRVEDVVVPAHPSSKDQSPRSFRQMVKRAKADGLFAFVDVPSDPGRACTIHFWRAAETGDYRLAGALGHELGHISGGGPFLDFEPAVEEYRANLYGDVAREVVMVLEALKRPGVIKKRKRK